MSEQEPTGHQEDYGIDSTKAGSIGEVHSLSEQGKHVKVQSSNINSFKSIDPNVVVYSDEKHLNLPRNEEREELQIDSLSNEAQNIPPNVLPEIDPESGLYEDGEGLWGGNKYFGEKDIQYLSRRRDRVRTVDGLGARRNRTTLYNVEEAQKLLQERDGARVGSDGIHVEGDESWGSSKYFGAKDFAYLEGAEIRVMEGTGAGGKRAVFYNINDARKALQERDSLPQIDAETGVFEDESGRWGSRKYFSPKDVEYLKSQLDRVRQMKGRSNSQVSLLFNVEDAQIVLQERSNLPQVDEIGVFEDESGKWGSAKYFGRIDINYLRKRKQEIKSKKGRAANGDFATLYEIEDATRILQERDAIKSTEISPDVADELMRGLEEEL